MSKKTDKTLNKCDELMERLNELKKALNQIETMSSTNVASNRKPVNTLGVGWSQDPVTGALHHSTHGVISPGKQPDGTFRPVHGGKIIGTFNNIADAGRAMGEHARSLKGMDTGMVNRQSPNVPVSPKLGTGNAWAVKKDDKLKKSYTPAQLAAIQEARNLKKNAEGQPWVTHSSVPNADQELAKVQAANPVNKAEDIMANQLANVMAGKAMLGIKPPPQPTDEQLFGHLVPSEEDIQKAEHAWSNRMNWLEEAVKPISSRFSSPEEEQAYWDSLKVRDDGKGDYGF